MTVDEVRDSLSAQAGLLSELLTAAAEPHLKRAGIGLATFELLTAVHALKSRGTQADIARRLGITPPSLSESVQSAVKLGLVTQEKNPADARTRFLAMTPKGSRALRQVMQAVKEIEEAMLSGMSSDELDSAMRVLRKANRNLAYRIQIDGNGANS